MADRVSASIRIGGVLARADLPALSSIVAEERLSTDWDGSDFIESVIPADGPLELMANEVAWGRFELLEQFCVTHCLPFVRWSGGYVGSWEAERVVFDGAGDQRSFTVTESDQVVITRGEARHLGTIEAIHAYFASADPCLPPLTIADDDQSTGGCA